MIRKSKIKVVARPILMNSLLFPPLFLLSSNRIPPPLSDLTTDGKGEGGGGRGGNRKGGTGGEGILQHRNSKRTSSFPGCFSSLFCLFLLLSYQGRHSLPWAALPPRSHFEPLQERPSKHVHVLHGARSTPVPLLNGSSFLVFPTFYKNLS